MYVANYSKELLQAIAENKQEVIQRLNQTKITEHEALALAIQAGFKEEIILLIEKGADRGMALIYAAENDMQQAIDTLILSYTCTDWALTIAAHKNKQNAVQNLIDKGVCKNLALAHAANYNMQQAIDTLITKGADKERALATVANNDEQLAKDAIDILVNKGASKDKALAYAANIDKWLGKKAIITLIALQADKDWALAFAIQNDLRKAITALLVEGADKVKALAIAANNNMPKTVDSLINEGVNKDRAFAIAANNNMQQAANTLINRGIDEDKALAIAADNNMQQTVNTLLIRGANKDQALAYAVYQDMQQSVDILLNKGASKDNALVIVTNNGQDKAIVRLIQLGAQPDYTNQRSFQALVAYNQLQAIEAFLKNNFDLFEDIKIWDVVNDIHTLYLLLKHSNAEQLNSIRDSLGTMLCNLKTTRHESLKLLLDRGIAPYQKKASWRVLSFTNTSNFDPLDYKIDIEIDLKKQDRIVQEQDRLKKAYAALSKKISFPIKRTFLDIKDQVYGKDPQVILNSEEYQELLDYHNTAHHIVYNEDMILMLILINLLGQLPILKQKNIKTDKDEKQTSASTDETISKPILIGALPTDMALLIINYLMPYQIKDIARPRTNTIAAVNSRISEIRGNFFTNFIDYNDELTILYSVRNTLFYKPLVERNKIIDIYTKFDNKIIVNTNKLTKKTNELFKTMNLQKEKNFSLPAP